jgi:hypothetical protein
MGHPGFSLCVVKVRLRSGLLEFRISERSAWTLPTRFQRNVPVQEPNPPRYMENTSCWVVGLGPIWLELRLLDGVCHGAGTKSAGLAGLGRVAASLFYIETAKCCDPQSQVNLIKSAISSFVLYSRCCRCCSSLVFLQYHRFNRECLALGIPASVARCLGSAICIGTYTGHE